MNVQGYKVEIQKLNPDLGGGFIAFAPELAGCASDGETQAIALLNLEDAVEMWLDTAREIGRLIPNPSMEDAQPHCLLPPGGLFRFILPTD